jgi:hypothetical protein
MRLNGNRTRRRLASCTVLTLNGSAATTAVKIFHVRTWNHLVEKVSATAGGTIVRLARVDIDSQGASSEAI